MKIDFSNANILVFGEGCIDEFVYLKTVGKSPEANAPKTKIVSKSEKFGMARNVFNNLNALDCSVSLSSNPSDQIRKTRYYVDNKYQFRVDQEGRLDLEDIGSEDILDLIREEFFLYANTDYSNCGILISDYGKGYINAQLVEECVKTGLPVLVDPHPTQPIEKYKGCTFICPNKEESRILTKYNDLISSSYKFLKTTQCKGVLNKLSESGLAFISNDKNNYYHEALCKRPVDVCGAGDTTVAAFFAAYLSQYSISECLKIASCAAKVVVEKSETATCSLEELQKEIDIYFNTLLENELK